MLRGIPENTCMQAEYGHFDFGLTEEQESRAKRLHADSLIIDMLHPGIFSPSSYPDALQAELKKGWETERNPHVTIWGGLTMPGRLCADGKLDLYRERWLGCGLTGANREVEMYNLTSFAGCFSTFQYEFDRCDWMIKALKAEDFRRAKRLGKAAGYISTQLGNGPFPDLSILRAGHDLGLRMVMLTYNNQSSIGAGCTERSDAGVSHFGRQAIELMNKLGIIVDTGHCGRRTTLDACELSSKPIVASHTAAKALCPHDRGKTDEEFKAIAATGGVIGLVTVPFFLSESSGADMNVFLDHVEHVVNLVGAQHVGIGTDWPLQLPMWLLEDVFVPIATGSWGFRKEHRIDAKATLKGFSDYMDLPNITRGLVARGYSDSDVRGILGGNFLRVFEQVCG